MAAATELQDWTEQAFTPDTGAPAAGAPSSTDVWAAAAPAYDVGDGAGAPVSGLHDKKASRAVVRDLDAPLNEPEENLTFTGILRRGWFLFTFQTGKQLLAGFLGALPLALLFAVTITFPQMAPDGYGDLWFIGLLVFDLAFVVYLPSIGGAVTCLSGAAHVGDHISISTAYRRTWAHYGQLILAFCGVYMGTIVGLYLLIVPGIWFVSRYGLAWVIVPLEKCTVSEAFARSAQLQRGRGGVALAIHGIMALINALVVALFVVVTVLWNAATDNPVVKFFVLFVYMELLILSVVPYIPVLTAFYYDCVRRHRLQAANTLQI